MSLHLNSLLFPHHHLSLSFISPSTTRPVITLWGCQPVWPLLWREVGSGWCQAQSLPCPNSTWSWGRSRNFYFTLALLHILLCTTAVYYAAVEWPGQRATLYWQIYWTMRKRKVGGCLYVCIYVCVSDTSDTERRVKVAIWVVVVWLRKAVRREIQFF